MPDEAYKVSINLPALEHVLALNVQRVCHFIAAASDGPPSRLIEPLYGQGTVLAYQYAPKIPWTTEEAVAEFRSWVLLNGFRDLAETLTHFLTSVQSISTTALLQEIQADAGHITPTQWHDLVVARERQFERANLPDKLKLLADQSRLDIPNEVSISVQSLYSLRNCLVHRAGIVQETDLRGETSLCANWLTMRPYIVTDDGAQPLVMPHWVEKAGHIEIRRELASKEFRLGQRIAISSEEFFDISHGVFVAGAVTVKALEDRLRSAGITMFGPPST